MRITDQYFWNLIFLFFFGCVLLMATIILETEATRAYESLLFVDYVLMTLASFRLVRLVVYDKMFAFLREQFYDVTEYKGNVVLIKAESGPRRTLADLITCPWCVGVWAVLIVSFFYLLTSYAVYPVLLLALSGVVSLLQIIANLIGWKAEQAKLDTESR